MACPTKSRRSSARWPRSPDSRVSNCSTPPLFARAKEKEIDISGKGTYFYSLELGGRGVSIVTTDEKKQQILVDRFGIHFSIPTGLGDSKLALRDVGVVTSLTLGDGETIVVGASQIQDHSKEPAAAIITVVTGKIVG